MLLAFWWLAHDGFLLWASALLRFRIGGGLALAPCVFAYGWLCWFRVVSLVAVSDVVM